MRKVHQLAGRYDNPNPTQFLAPITDEQSFSCVAQWMESKKKKDGNRLDRLKTSNFQAQLVYAELHYKTVIYCTQSNPVLMSHIHTSQLHYCPQLHQLQTHTVYNDSLGTFLWSLTFALVSAVSLDGIRDMRSEPEFLNF